MPVGNPNWFAALPINDLVRWSFNADRCFIIMPRSDSDDGYGRQRANPDHLDEPLNALVNMGDSNNRYLQYVDYGAGNIDWISADGREHISWTGGTMRYAHGVLAGTIAQHLTGQAENGARVEYDKAGGGGSYTSELIGDSTSPDQYIWRHGVRYDVGGEILGAMAYSEPGHSYFIVAYRATTETAGIRTIKLTRVEFDPDTDQTIGSQVDLTSDMVADCGGGIPTGLTAPILQPVFFNRAGTQLCTIAALKIGDNTDYYVITAETTNSSRSAWTFHRGEACVKANTKTTTTTKSGSFGGGTIEDPPGSPPYYTFPASYGYSLAVDISHRAIFAVDWCNEKLTTATVTIRDVTTETRSSPSVVFLGQESGPYEIHQVNAATTLSQSQTVNTSIKIAGGWSKSYTLSSYTDVGGGSFTYPNDSPPGPGTPENVTGSGSFTGYRRGLVYLDMRHRHIVIAEDQETISGGSGEMNFNSLTFTYTLDVDLNGSVSKSIDHTLFNNKQSDSFGSFSISGSLQFAHADPPADVGEYTSSVDVQTTDAYEGPNGPWYGNSNWTTIATLADGKTAWLHMAVSWPAIVSDLPWSPSNANSRHWINRTTGPLAPPSLSAIANGVGLSGSNPRFHAVRPAIIPSPETSPDAPE